MQARFLELAGKELAEKRRIAFCQTEGQSPGIVFLGGFSSDMTGTKATYLEQWAQQRGRAFLRFDYTGHGQSSGRFEEGCISDWYRDAEDVIASLTRGPQLLIGSSMGGWISLLLAARRPESVCGIVGIAAAPDFTADFENRILSDSQLRELVDKGKVVLPSEYSDDGLTITRRLLEDGRENFVFDQPLSLPFPVRLLQGCADEDVAPAVPVRLLEHAVGQDIQLQLVKAADHSFSSEACLLLIARAADDILTP
ncbi:MAG: alpha/beta hydrolase [Rhodobacteraceae bacterium]|nr:alpha/beta hydrolase [Paracoccaceae bacterium]